jgi:chromosome segregation and condensation protein ScpB
MEGKLRGTKLKVFSGKEATLNHTILRILEKQMLIAYDVWLTTKTIKGFRHTPYRSICRRIQALEQQNWITKKGKRPIRPTGTSDLYEITPKAKAALYLSEKTMDTFLETAPEEKLLQLIETLK